MPNQPDEPKITPVRPAYATVQDWCQLSGMGRTKTFAALGTGQLRAKKLGTRTLIDVEHGLAWMASLPNAQVRDFYRKQAA